MSTSSNFMKKYGVYIPISAFILFVIFLLQIRSWSRENDQRQFLTEVRSSFPTKVVKSTPDTIKVLFAEESYYTYSVDDGEQLVTTYSHCVACQVMGMLGEKGIEFKFIDEDNMSIRWKGKALLPSIY